MRRSTTPRPIGTSTFCDALGRQWRIVIDGSAIGRIRDEIGLDLNEKGAWWVNRLLDDPVLVHQLLALLLGEEAAVRGIDSRSFAQGIRAEGIDNATESIFEAVERFHVARQAALRTTDWFPVGTPARGI